MFRSLSKDLPASIVVFFVALPLCLGIALASGAPLFSGLIAGIVGGIVVGTLSGSSLGVSGPAAGLTVIVLSALDTLGSFEVFLLAVVIAGGLQVVLGTLRAGVLGYFFPSSVIQGMLSGIGIIILLKQIPHAFGYDRDPEGDMAFHQPDGGTTFSALSDMLDFIDPAVLVLSLCALGIMILWDYGPVRRFPKIAAVPGPVVAVAFGLLWQFVLGGAGSDWAISSAHLVSVPVTDSLAGVVDLLTFPDFGAIGNAEVWTVAVTLAVVASLETLLSVEAVDKLDPHKRVTPTNRELVAQGVGNSVSGLIGGLPVTQVIVRSSANVHSGAETKLSAIVHGVLLLVCVLTLPTLLNQIPLAVLAAVLIITGYKLAKPAVFQKMWRNGLEQFLPFVITILGVVLSDLLTGVGIGLAVAIIILLQKNFRNSHFLHMESTETDGISRVTMRLAEEVSFLNKGAVLESLGKVPNGAKLVIDQSQCVHIDHDVREIITDFCQTAAERDIEVTLIPSR